MNDNYVSIGELRKKVAQFVEERHWGPYHNAKNLSMSIAIEAAELQEHFQWKTSDEGQLYLQDEKNLVEVADELADILIYCFSFANQAGIDISSAINAKIFRNEARFPKPKT